MLPTAIVYGKAVHPDASMVCASAIVDKSNLYTVISIYIIDNKKFEKNK